ncbi:MAG: response regulator [Actinomycetota bacterium]|nr:response regulator [Actinomycetota bacterium]
MDRHSSGFGALYSCVGLLPAALCILRAVLVKQERAVWALFGAGLVAFAAANGYYFIALQDLESPPYPSLSDALWLSCYAAFFVALMLLMRARLKKFRGSFWIDAGVGMLALASIGAALLMGPILESTGGSFAAVATNLAYPLADLLIISLVLGVFALSGWRPGRAWLVLGVVFALFCVFDTIYLYQVASGTYEAGTLLDASWPVLMMGIALAAWHEPRPLEGRGLQGWPALLITAVFALVGLFIITYDHWKPVEDYVVVLAALTLVTAFLRSAMTFGAMRERLLVQHQSILNAAGEGICGLDRDGRTTFINPAAARMTGYEPQDVLGRNWHELVHHTRPDGTHYPVEECPTAVGLQDGTVHHSDNDVYGRKDGTTFPVEFTSTPIVEDGYVMGAVAVFKDVSERREVERTKDEFTSVVSHELRTPLTSIRGSLGLLESGMLGPLPEKGQRMIEIAVENTDRLVRLINDILDIERIDSGQSDMHEQACDAAELIERAVQGLGQLAAEAQVKLIADARPAVILADPDRVIQTLTNLISNAVKFSPEGSSVQVSAAHRDHEVLFSVSDEGPGIPADKLDSIFGRFQQVDASDSREKGGTGLGLAICRTIVEHHGGRIWAESKLGSGATFSFVLPAQATTDAPPLGRVEGGPTVLVCDDDAAVVEVVGTMLEQRGYRVLPAYSGEQALERAVADRPDAILLDLLMPGMSGLETAAALKQSPETREVPILILSVLSEAEAGNAGERFTDWIEKPLDEAALFQALERAVGPRVEPFKVLIVEDDRDLAAVLTATFERHGIETFHAADGHEAIELSQQVLPDLLVLDVGLPEADGFQVVDWLRHHERLSAVPMVIYTARELEASDRDRLRLGASTEFLTKGRITPQDFEKSVIGLLGRLTQQRTPEASDEREAHLVGR